MSLMLKCEIRNPTAVTKAMAVKKSERNPKSEIRKGGHAGSFRISAFGLPSAFGGLPGQGRISDFFPALRGVLALVLLGTAIKPASAQTLHYLRQGQLDPLVLLPPPPAPGSAEQAADLASVTSIYKTHTTNDTLQAELDTKLGVFAFSSVLGSSFQPQRLPKAEAFFKRIVQDTKAVVDAGKDHWKRPRPYHLDPRLASDQMEQTYSYPSGHSTRGTVQALLLAEALPAKADAILAFGRSIGWRRVLLAHHYPTDVYAGRCLGQAIVRELKANAAFQRDFAEVKAEIAAAIGQGNGTDFKPQMNTDGHR